MEAIEIKVLLDEMVEGLRSLIIDKGLSNPAIVGIQTGGVWIAEYIHQQLGIKDDLGRLGISFYRDDFSCIGLHPQVAPSSLPFSTENRDIILVDDVLYTGRTIRAALNAIFDFGRPNSISLAVLVDRGCRELPFQADVVGKRLSLAELSKDEQIKLSGPEPLKLSVHKIS